MKVQDVCTAGDAEACERVKFTETGSFAGGVLGGGIAGSIASVSSVGGLCIGLGLASAGTGTIACGLVITAAGSFAGGILGEKVGEIIGEKIYEKAR